MSIKAEIVGTVRNRENYTSVTESVVLFDNLTHSILTNRIVGQLREN